MFSEYLNLFVFKNVVSAPQPDEPKKGSTSVVKIGKIQKNNSFTFV